MSITLNFELNDRDLAHFTAAMDRSKKAAEGKTADEIIAASVALLDDAQKVHIPDFIKERLLRLDDMIAMVRDAAWALPDADKQRVLGALTYFCDPQDVIPDRQFGTESRLDWVMSISDLPGATTSDNFGTEKTAKIVSFQHPDHD